VAAFRHDCASLPQSFPYSGEILPFRQNSFESRDNEVQKGIEMQDSIGEAANINEIEPGVLTMIRDEREKALSPREWKFRLRGYGYGIKTVEGEQILTRLPKNVPIGVLPPEFC
jgi:hypothetical protein